MTGRAAIIDAAIGLLTCPVCARPLGRDRGTLRCPVGHSFDLAQQGQVNLLGHRAPANADTGEMIAARHRFLSTGHYSPIRAAVQRASHATGPVVEVGAGTGYYLAGVVASTARAHLALDVSPAAARQCARAGLAAAVADTWAGLPIASGSVTRLLCIFAPRNPAEFARVLEPAGRVVVVSAGPAHLAALRARFGLLNVHPAKHDRMDAAFAEAGLELADREMVEFPRSLDGPAVADLVAMGPNAFHGGSPAPASGQQIVVSVVLSQYRHTRQV